MKKMVFAIMTALTISMSAMAQDANQEGTPQRRQFDPKEMIQRRTDGVVKRYGLNEEQAKKLLDLNTRFADKMGPRGNMQRPPRQGNRPDSMAGNRHRGERPQRGQGGPMGGPMSEEMQKNMEAYNAELKTIMTEEQYKAYTEDMKNRPQRRGGGRGPRPNE